MLNSPMWMVRTNESCSTCSVVGYNRVITQKLIYDFQPLTTIEGLTTIREAHNFYDFHDFQGKFAVLKLDSQKKAHFLHNFCAFFLFSSNSLLKYGNL